MSGGIDSAMTTWLLTKRLGYRRVVGVNMLSWDTRDDDDAPSSTATDDDAIISNTACPGKENWLNVRRVCEQLRVDCVQWRFVSDYWCRVFEPALREYQRGATPSPDIACNREVKFGALFDAIESQEGSGNDWLLATGHYARLNGDSALRRGIDRTRDQSYFLSGVKGERLARTLMPLGGLLKSQVRDLARENGFEYLLKRKESTGVCFVGERPGRFDRFLSGYLDNHPGLVVDVDDEKKVLGNHHGLYSVTIGQRWRRGGLPGKFYVVKKDCSKNVVHVSRHLDHPELFRSQLGLRNVHWINEAQIERVKHCQIRYRDDAVPCQLNMLSDHDLSVDFETPVHAAAPGQVAAFYSADNQQCLGHATIADEPAV